MKMLGTSTFPNFSAEAAGEAAGRENRRFEFNRSWPPMLTGNFASTGLA